MSQRERKLQRLKGYDYSENNYSFVTICCKDKQHFFGEVKEHEMTLNELGKIIEFSWLDLPNHYFNCFIDEFIIMPNHFHGIVIVDSARDKRNGSKPFL
jgi:putative transposase